MWKTWTHHGSNKMSMNKTGGAEFRHLVLNATSYVAFNLSENQLIII